jgi:hypothetical protein
MNQIKQFFYEYRTEITWFLIGFMTLDGLQAIGRGDYLNATLSFALVYLNYKLR